MGSGRFAHSVLVNLIREELLPKLLVTIPPTQKGRGLKLQDPSIRYIAEGAGIPVLQPETPNAKIFLEELKTENPDFILVSDYGKILKAELLRLPTVAPVNIHPSLLPFYRGAAPIERAMMDCNKTLGVSIFIMDEGIDTGPILSQESFEIKDTDTKGEVIEQLAKIGVRLFKDVLPKLLRGDITPVEQKKDVGSYAKKIRKEELWIDWSLKAKRIVCHINALSPEPCARTYIDGRLTKLYRAKVIEELSGERGKILSKDKRLIIFADQGGVEILEIQPEGKRRLTAQEYLVGYSPLKAYS